MSRRIIPRDLVAEKLAVSLSALDRYESLGWVRPVCEGPVAGYEPEQIRRLWTIVSFQRDLGINLAGVEVILQLFEHLSEVHRRMDLLAMELRELLDVDAPGSASDLHD
jgi:MerR family transcriptional regulator/heat shock protein HspR